MESRRTAEPQVPGLATRAEAEVRAVLSALRDLSNPADAAEPPVVPDGDRYRRVSLHAQGGLGQVWLGRDELVGRDVAIKEPRSDRPGDIARTALEREAWILGRLQHPNIVPLYDLVRRPDGRAEFYVMPFLDGDGLYALAQRFHRARPAGGATRLSLLPLLTAFLDVCGAIDHAHGRGVWHLDIKGDNVKLGPTGAAIVLDWGLARLSAPAAGEPPTRMGAAGGTPAFMAPEQAEPSGAHIGPHTDVYGLGALLYLLLTGQPPHPPIAECGRAELVAALRQNVVAPRTFWGSVPRALEALCLRALAVEPAQRYASVAAMRADVQHWLADEPVTAYRERFGERVARWGRRHRRVATASAAALLTAVLALAVGLVIVDCERQETDRQRETAETALARERDSFRQALKAGDDYFTAVSDSPRLQEPGQQPLRRELLERGLAYYQDFLTRRGDEPALRSEVAAAWYRVGQIHAAIGTLPDALAAFEQALRHGEALLAACPIDADLQARLARWYIAATANERRTGRFAEAFRRLDRAAELAAGLPEDHPQRRFMSALALAMRAAVLDLAGDYAGACVAAAQADREFARATPDVTTRSQRATNLIRLGQLYRGQNHLDDATAAVRQARALFEGLRGEPGLALTAQWRLADCDHTLGLIATAALDRAAALQHFSAAYSGRRQLVAHNPAVHTHRAELISTCLHLGRYCRYRGDMSRAEEFSHEACAQADELMARDPTDYYMRSVAIRVYRLAAGDAETRGDLPVAARRRCRAAELLAGFPTLNDAGAWRAIAQEAVQDGLPQLCLGQWRAAVESFRQADACLRRARQPIQMADQRASAVRQ
jgi:serine/threonine-protein kinase